MLWVPALRLLVLHDAVLVLAAPPGNATALQPRALPPSVNATLPVGAAPLTVAVKVTFAPTGDGVPELASVVVVGVDDYRCSSCRRDPRWRGRRRA